jgi:hypothetical protein
VLDKIIGSPYQVPRDTTFLFCIRASRTENDITEIADRTFKITVQGESIPKFITPAGPLAINYPTQYFVLDSTYVYYQIEAVDSDTIAGQQLTYFITEGTLPPGLSLTADGKIYGVVESVTTLQPAEGNGTYDHGYYDVGPYDFANQQRQNGYDELRYDYIGYDFFFVNQPRTLNRFYEFVVAVTDGDTLICCVVAPLFQRKAPPEMLGFPISIALFPSQMVVSLKLTVGTGLTATVTVSAKLGHPLSVYTTE